MTWSITTETDRILPEGYYDAVVEDLEKIAATFNGEERAIWKFFIPSEGVTVVGFSSLAKSLKAKGAGWAKNILSPTAEEFTWGPGELRGKPCTVYVEVAEDKNGDERNIVTKVKPPRDDGKSSHASGAPSDDKGNEDFTDIPF
jgi:hypothetical protein